MRVDDNVRWDDNVWRFNVWTSGVSILKKRWSISRHSTDAEWLKVSLSVSTSSTLCAADLGSVFTNTRHLFATFGYV